MLSRYLWPRVCDLDNNGFLLICVLPGNLMKHVWRYDWDSDILMSIFVLVSSCPRCGEREGLMRTWACKLETLWEASVAWDLFPFAFVPMMTTLWFDDDDGEPLRIVTASVPVLARRDALEFSLSSEDLISSYP